jgi:hypothetical protein
MCRTPVKIPRPKRKGWQIANMMDYIIMVLAKARSQEILTPSLHSKPHHHLRLVERRFRPDPSRCAECQINCHPKTLAVLESTRRTAGRLAQAANSVFSSRKQLNSRRRRIFL